MQYNSISISYCHTHSPFVPIAFIAAFIEFYSYVYACCNCLSYIFFTYVTYNNNDNISYSIPFVCCAHTHSHISSLLHCNFSIKYNNEYNFIGFIRNSHWNCFCFRHLICARFYKCMTTCIYYYYCVIRYDLRTSMISGSTQSTPLQRGKNKKTKSVKPREREIKGWGSEREREILNEHWTI